MYGILGISQGKKSSFLTSFFLQRLCRCHENQKCSVLIPEITDTSGKKLVLLLSSHSMDNFSASHGTGAPQAGAVTHPCRKGGQTSAKPSQGPEQPALSERILLLFSSASPQKATSCGPGFAHSPGKQHSTGTAPPAALPAAFPIFPTSLLTFLTTLPIHLGLLCQPHLLCQLGHQVFPQLARSVPRQQFSLESHLVMTKPAHPRALCRPGPPASHLLEGALRAGTPP